MKHFAVYDSLTGNGRWVSSVAPEAPPLDFSSEGLSVIEVEEPLLPPFYVAEGEIVRGEKPLPAAQAEEAQWRIVRTRRTAKLNETSWRVERALEEGQPVPLKWREYRQALRDITLQPDPFNIQWPEEPK